ncbi:class I fructose-bisphosphate aldolase [Paenibacillus eucommiae]|uniref:DhnA family fructose-bisphosphate aldolase class Ia n=1 Tax=Paenibacillus eucommiae TaxID=1355755 RepID=A0ABS4ITB4_9BACL|nr:aldolase [Paenibacillus eucommiae]MBP1990814.1 DhnA family fructose-bisphosphate aldolase class Ia [Paenibacillus eucommiae]
MFKKTRMNRLFASDGKCFDVAIDHGFFNELAFLAGIENMQKAIETVVDADPDAIQVSIGQAHFLQDRMGKKKPSLVLRSDTANIYGNTLPSYTYSQLFEGIVEQAVLLDAACIVVNLFLLPNQPELLHQCIRNITFLKPQCDKYGMPLMIEPLAMLPNDKVGGYMVDGDINKILPLVRQAVELGADLIKADPCDHVEEYHRVIEMASGKPVLVRGGGLASDEEVLIRTCELMKQGASGIVYGRNVVQHHNPAGITRALMAVVHEGADSDKALAMLHKRSHLG